MEVMANEKYRKMQGELDQWGDLTTIERISKNQFDWIVNGELEGSFAKRESCNKRLIKLYTKVKQHEYRH